MGDRTLEDALQVVTTPDYEAMVVGAHPDDCDFGAAGTTAVWTKQGKKVVWVVVTNGTEGSEVPSIPDQELMIQREAEQRAAAEVLGVKDVEFLRFQDGHLVNSEDVRKQLVRLVRKYRPRVVVTHDPTMQFWAPDPYEQPDATAYLNHPDHRATGQAVIDAIFPLAGNPRSYRELLAEGYLPYKVHELYLFMTATNNTFVDVTDTLDLKVEALKRHVSQFDPDFKFLEFLKQRMADTAVEAKKIRGEEMQYAESFRRVKLHVPEPVKKAE